MKNTKSSRKIRRIDHIFVFNLMPRSFPVAQFCHKGMHLYRSPNYLLIAFVVIQQITVTVSGCCIARHESGTLTLRSSPTTIKSESTVGNNFCVACSVLTSITEGGPQFSITEPQLGESAPYDHRQECCHVRQRRRIPKLSRSTEAYFDPIFEKSSLIRC